MKRQLFAGIAAAAIVVAFATAGNAASPSSGSVGPSSTSTSWNGQSFTVGATQSPSACPPASDSSNSLCDHYNLTVQADASYWKTHKGSVTVSIRWTSKSNNFDLYAYSGGNQVASSAQSTGTSEGFTIGNPTGTYEIRVVPKDVLVLAGPGQPDHPRHRAEHHPPRPAESLNAPGAGAAGTAREGAHALLRPCAARAAAGIAHRAVRPEDRRGRPAPGSARVQHGRSEDRGLPGHRLLAGLERRRDGDPPARHQQEQVRDGQAERQGTEAVLDVPPGLDRLQLGQPRE